MNIFYKDDDGWNLVIVRDGDSIDFGNEIDMDDLFHFCKVKIKHNGRYLTDTEIEGFFGNIRRWEK